MTTLVSHLSKTAGRRPGRITFSVACALALAAAPGSPLLRTADAAPTPAAASASSDTPIDAIDIAKLRDHLNQQVTIKGTPNASGVSKSNTVAYLNFAGPHQGVALVFFLKAGQSGKASSVEDIKAFIGKPITVKGTLTEFKGDLQISVESLDQIKTE